MAGGSWCPTPELLRHLREAIVYDTDRFCSIVDEPRFHELFPVVGEAMLKTMPKGFPSDFPRPELLRPRAYTVYSPIADTLVGQPDGMDRLTEMFRTMHPFNAFLNEVFDDYE